MKKKEFKSESKKLLDMMINSVYTNKDIFLRELISNGSDAIDKLYYKSLTEETKVDKKDLRITIELDKKNRTIKLSDNGCGMTKDELESNLGTIAKSGSFDFKENTDKKKNINIIGQFGVGFYSAFMVSSEVEVLSKAMESDTAYLWKSSGSDGYTIDESKKDEIGTLITLHIKDGEEYDEYLEEHKIKSLIKKYSDYISYPIELLCEHKEPKKDNKDEFDTIYEYETINSMVPLWNKNKSKIKDEEYNNFYMDKFNDYSNPLKVIHFNVEGLYSYRSILFIPSKAPYDFYTKEYKKGLQLYSNGVLIMDKCEELLPDYFSFIKGVVDSDDLSLNISRETLQNDKKLSGMSKSIESKINKELTSMLNEDKDKYKEFFKEFGIQLKYGVYNNFGMDKDKLQDLLIFYSASKNDFITLNEYVSEMKEDQKDIYYACGESKDKINMLPQVEQIKNKNYDILYLTEYVDEFAIKAIGAYKEKEFMNAADSKLDLDSKEEKEAIEKINTDSKDILETMKEALPEVKGVKYTNKLTNNPVCLTAEGEVSIEMEKVINRMPGTDKISAEYVLEINKNHPIVKKLEDLYNTDKEELKKYAKVLYSEARLIEGLQIENPTEISNIIVDMMSK